MNDLNKLPYAQWLEDSLKNIIGLPIQSICILTKMEDGSMGSGYYDCSVADKLVFAGVVQQDAMIETLQNNGMILSEEDDEEDPDNG